MADAMPAFEDRYWRSPDGLRLHARDYPGEGTPILCLPGLTRNARDFEPLATRLAGRRLLALSFRGRGASDHAGDTTTYSPAEYFYDVVAFLDAVGVDRFAVVGTSLGGIVAMHLAANLRGRFAGATLNDVGPAIEAAGLRRILGYVGKPSSEPTWMHAARCLAEGNADIYPDWRIEDWLAMAKRLYRMTPGGRVVLDYDLRIAEPLRTAGEPPPDLWVPLAAMAGLPVLIVRGERSDVLGAATAAAMVERLPGAELVTVPRIGHAPLLDEPVLAAPIDRWLARIGEPPRL